MEGRLLGSEATTLEGRTLATKPSKQVTIIEVARRAGVSPATAGRVLGAYGYASNAIQKKVRAAALALGYRPNRLARGLITGKTQTIGMVAGDIESPFYASVLRGVGDAVRRQGFGVIVTNSDENLELEREAVQLLLEKQVDGLIVSPASPASAADTKHLTQAGLHCPLVQVDRIGRGLESDSVVLDNVDTARRCVARLLQAGHRRIGILLEAGTSRAGDLEALVDKRVRVSSDPRGVYPSWQRLIGYLEAHREAGVPVDVALISRVAHYSTEAAKRVTIQVMSAKRRPSALFTADGAMSTGALEGLVSLRLSFPEDVSLICFDDLDWMKFVAPGITAVAQPVYRMGVAAADLLLARIAEPAKPFQRIVLAAEIIERGSIGTVSSSPLKRRRESAALRA